MPDNSSHTRSLRRAAALLAAAVAIAAAAPSAGAATPQIDAGDDALCVLGADGRVTCHGLDASGVAHVADFQQIAVGLSHACGLRASGEALCWPQEGPAAAFPPPGSFTDVGAGWSASCALDAGGAGMCWGDDAGYGELFPPPRPLHGLSVGEFHSCALVADGEAACWGADVNGQSSAAPGPFEMVSAGGGHTCGLRPSGDVDCWGLDNAGQAQDRSAAPGDPFAAVSAGSTSTCALTDGGRLICWGSDYEGESSPPEGTFSSVSVGRGYACATRTTGELTCWGDPPLPTHDYAVSFHAPVDAPPTVNVAKAGRVIPVKVEIFDHGQEVRAGRVTLDVAASDDCSAAAGDAVEAYAAAAATAAGELRWDGPADRWRTELDTSGLGPSRCFRGRIQVDGAPAGHFVLQLRG